MTGAVAPVEQVADEAFYRPATRRLEPLFNPEQQKAFDKAFRKREAKIRAEYEPMLRDLLDTVEVTQQLLERCKDRISTEDECSIRDGLQAIRRDHVEKRNVRRSA